RHEQRATGIFIVVPGCGGSGRLDSGRLWARSRRARRVYEARRVVALKQSGKPVEHAVRYIGKPAVVLIKFYPGGAVISAEPDRFDQVRWRRAGRLEFDLRPQFFH